MGVFPKGEQFRRDQPGPLPDGLKHEYAILSSGTTHYVLRKPQNPSSPIPIVLVHGFTYEAVWHPIAQMLYERDNRIVLAYDNYGRGWSSSPDRRHHGDLYTTQLAELLWYLNISGPIDLLGMSQGGAISLLFTSRFPQKVNRLGLVAAAGLPILDEPGVAKLVTAPTIGKALFKLAFENAYAKEFRKSCERAETSQLAIQEFHDSVREHPGYLRALQSTLKYFPMGKLEPILKELGQTFDKPAIVLLGTADVLMNYQQNKQTYQSLWPSATIATVEGGCHCFCAERPEETYKHLQQFLKA